MINVWFDNGDRRASAANPRCRVIGQTESLDDVGEVIDKFLFDKGYFSEYIRSWTEDDKLMYDVGCHSQFFFVYKSEIGG